MAIQEKVPSTPHSPPRRKQLQQKPMTQPAKPLGVRDRLLAVLESPPRLRQKDAEMINRVVREAREASLADELSA